MPETTGTAETAQKPAAPSAQPSQGEVQRQPARQRIPWWASHPPTLAVAGMLLAIGELVAYRSLGVVGWLIANAALVVLLFGAALVWRRRGRTAGRAGGAGRTHRPGGLIGRIRPSGRGGPGGTSTSGRRIFGGRGRVGAGSGSHGGATGGGPGRRSGLLGRLTGRGRGTAGGGRPAGGGTEPGGPRGGASRRWWPFGRSGRSQRSGGKPGGGTPSAGGPAGLSGGTGKGSPGGRRWWPFKRSGRTGGGGADGVGGSGSAGGGAKGGGAKGGGAKGGATKPLGKRRWWRPRGGTSGGSGSTSGTATGGKKLGDSKPSGKSTTPPQGGDPKTNPDGDRKGTKPEAVAGPSASGAGKRPWWRFPTLRRAGQSDADAVAGDPPAEAASLDVPGTPAAGPTSPAGKHAAPRPKPEPQPVPKAKHQRNPRRRAPVATNIHSDDASLQRWGRNLNLIAPALSEVAKQHDVANQAAREQTAAIRKIAQQADSDLPVSAALSAELESITGQLRQLDDEAEAATKRRAALIGRAEALPVTYRREHETDEDRLNAPRKSRAAEKRADVTAAEQDT
jgi:hypothetical protein